MTVRLSDVISDDSDLLMRRDSGGNLCLLVLRQPVPPCQLFPLRLHLIPELRVRLGMERRESVIDTQQNNSASDLPSCYSRLILGELSNIIYHFYLSISVVLFDFFANVF